MLPMAILESYIPRLGIRIEVTRDRYLGADALSPEHDK